MWNKCLWYLLESFNNITQFSFFCILKNKANISICFKTTIAIYNIRMLQRGMDFYFHNSSINHVIFFNSFFIDLFEDTNEIVCFLSHKIWFGVFTLSQHFNSSKVFLCNFSFGKLRDFKLSLGVKVIHELKRMVFKVDCILGNWGRLACTGFSHWYSWLFFGRFN